MGKFKNFGFLEIVSLCTILIALFATNISKLHNSPQKVAESDKVSLSLASKNDVGGQVLGNTGTRSRPPQIYFFGGTNAGASTGGMISLATTDEPAIYIAGYDISDEVSIDVYGSNKDNLLEYLTHDKEGNQTKKSPDIGSLTLVGNIKDRLDSGKSYDGTKFPLPLEGKGIWFLDIKIGVTKTTAFVVRSDFGVIAKEGDNELIFWGQGFSSRKSITGGNIKLLNLLDSANELQSSSFGSDGIAKISLDSRADIALAELDGSFSVVPLNLKFLNYSYSYTSFQPKTKLTRYFIFTDRPLYKPGDTVYFKAVLRDDDDAKYQIQSGSAVAKIYDGWADPDKEPLYEKSIPISADGTINGSYKIPESGKVGYYNLSVILSGQGTQRFFFGSDWASNSITFQVEYFQKPEFSLDITSSKTEVVAGEDMSFTVKGGYFSGQPLIGQKIKYTVYASDFYEYQFLMDNEYYSKSVDDSYRYGYWYGNNKAAEGTVTLGQNGEAKVEVNTKMDFNKGKSQIFSVEATIEDGSITPAFARKNILVYAGQYGIYRKDYKYGTKLNTEYALPLVLKSNKDNPSLSGINLTAKIHRENWIAYLEPEKKYPSYRKEEEDLSDISVKTDSSGNAVLKFTPAKLGSYTINVEGRDSNNNFISKTFYAYVSSEDVPYYSGSDANDLIVESDKQKYEPTDTALVNIFSTTDDRDVLLTLERGRVRRYQVVHMGSKKVTVDLPLVNTDIPNVYVKVSGFSSFALESSVINLPVSASSKKLQVKITPDQTKYGPSDNVKLNITTTDLAGNPVQADVAVWAVDKAIFELATSNLGNIFDTFWTERSNNTQEAHSLEGIMVRGGAEGGGCFAKGTKVLLANGKEVNIEDVKVGDYVLSSSGLGEKSVKAKVTGLHNTKENGYLIINTSLKVTPNHIVFGNGKWMEAGSLEIGDNLLSSSGERVEISSIEWQAGNFDVYNLEVEKYHTYYANGVLVHNQKGGDRTAFKDSAYWNPSVHTDSSGRAQVSFKLPDNLTTWALAAVASSTDTKVGQTVNEIIVSKDVIVRPILPNILRTGDTIMISAIVQNFTEKDHDFNVDLSFDSGEVEDPMKSKMMVKSLSTQQVYWKVRPNKEADKGKLTFSAKSLSDEKASDTIVQEIPVIPFEFEERWGVSKVGDSSFSIKLGSDSRNDKGEITLSLSPTLIGTLPSAMKYLVGYSYGCVEQTTSKFVPAVIAKLNPSLFGEVLKSKDVDDIIQKGVDRLGFMQQSSGGWSWWASGYNDPFVSVYVTEYLLQAKRAGFDVDNLLSRARSYFNYFDQISQTQSRGTVEEQKVLVNYGKILLGEKTQSIKSDDMSNLSPDIMSIAVMGNYLNGDKNSKTNGLERLISLAKQHGDTLYWEAGSTSNFGSREASTAFALRAITLAKGDREIATKAAKYLAGNRKNEYWSNTFATAQVIQAMLDYTKAGEELLPEYSYEVSLDGKQISKGAVTKSQQNIKDIAIKVNDIKSSGSDLSIKKSGDGQIYSTLVVREIHTDRNARAVNKGLKVEKEFVNEKGEEYTLGVGDTAIVKIKVSGLSDNAYYGVIADELPSGLVPINEKFLNEQYGRDYFTPNVSDVEITQNGAVLSLYQMTPGTKTYSYKARVVSEGSFVVPPARAELMYSPEIYGHSGAGTLNVNKTSGFNILKAGNVLTRNFLRIAIVVILVVIAVLIVTIFKLLRKSNKSKQPVETQITEKTSEEKTDKP